MSVTLKPIDQQFPVLPIRQPERFTDAPITTAQAPALGDDFDELIALLEPWGAAIRDAKGYPAGGPHDLANR